MAAGLAIIGGGSVAIARSGGGEPVGTRPQVVVNDSFLSPLVERFGDVRVGRGGDFTFIRFRACIHDAVIADGAFVLHGATVEGVRIPEDRIVGVGQVVRTQAQADALPRKTEGNADFQREVLEVNAEFAEKYPELYERGGERAVIGVGGSPRTSFDPGRRPTIGSNFQREPFARVVGDVRLGNNVTLGRRTSIRADEGAPISVGDNAEIEDRVTFHAPAVPCDRRQ